jgi:hypothetical protein
MRKTLLRVAGLSAVAAALASGTGADGQTGIGIVPQGTKTQVRLSSQSAYTVTPDAGPWLICAACYDGHVYESKAQMLAEEMAEEIRTQFNLKAFIFNRADEQRRQEREHIAQLREKQKKFLAERGLPPDYPLPGVKTIKIWDEYAVLVGGPYKDDVAARKDLDRIRKLQPSQKLMHTAFARDAKGKAHQEAVNPFQAAFVCRNPSIPVERPAADDKPDPRLKDYNAGEKYSLLACPKPFTLVVKSYQGASVLQQQSTPFSVMEKMGLGKKSSDLLDANAKMAHQVAEKLRQAGFEAYVLNTEYNSYVTVGGYDSSDDPRLGQMQQAFANELRNSRSMIGQLHVNAQVNFFTQPMPMPVPQVK